LNDRFLHSQLMNENAGESIRRISEEFKEKFKELDTDLASARFISRDVIYKIILICSSIIAFSVTLISIPQLSVATNVSNLRTSWYLFLLTIVLGFIALFLEGRLHYTLKWRAFQAQDFDEEYKYPFIDKLKVLGVCIYSIIFPRNLFFCRIYKTSQEKKHNALLNAKTVQALAEFEKIPFVIENLFVVSFIISLFIFIKSYA